MSPRHLHGLISRRHDFNDKGKQAIQGYVKIKNNLIILDDYPNTNLTLNMGLSVDSIYKYVLEQLLVNAIL